MLNLNLQIKEFNNATKNNLKRLEKIVTRRQCQKNIKKQKTLNKENAIQAKRQMIKTDKNQIKNALEIGRTSNLKTTQGNQAGEKQQRFTGKEQLRVNHSKKVKASQHQKIYEIPLKKLQALDKEINEELTKIHKCAVEKQNLNSELYVQKKLLLEVDKFVCLDLYCRSFRLVDSKRPDKGVSWLKLMKR